MIVSSLNCIALLTIIAVLQPSSQKVVEADVKDEVHLFSGQKRVKRNMDDAIAFPTQRPRQRPTASTPSADQSLHDRFGFSEHTNPTPPPANPLPCPDGQSFCDDALDYPREHITALLKRQPKTLLNMFQSSIEEEDSININRVNPGAHPEMETLCRSVPKRIFPRKAESEVGLFYVVNDDRHKQAIEVETCVNEKGKDECALPSLPAGYTSCCVQRHLQRVLIVLNQNFSGFITEPFDFPSCCSCVLVKLNQTSSITTPRQGEGICDRFRS